MKTDFLVDMANAIGVLQDVMVRHGYNAGDFDLLLSDAVMIGIWTSRFAAEGDLIFDASAKTNTLMGTSIRVRKQSGGETETGL